MLFLMGFFVTCTCTCACSFLEINTELYVQPLFIASCNWVSIYYHTLIIFQVEHGGAWSAMLLQVRWMHLRGICYHALHSLSSCVVDVSPGSWDAAAIHVCN